MDLWNQLKERTSGSGRTGEDGLDILQQPDGRSERERDFFSPLRPANVDQRSPQNGNIADANRIVEQVNVQETPVNSPANQQPPPLPTQVEEGGFASPLEPAPMAHPNSLMSPNAATNESSAKPNDNGKPSSNDNGAPTPKAAAVPFVSPPTTPNEERAAPKRNKAKKTTKKAPVATTNTASKKKTTAQARKEAESQSFNAALKASQACQKKQQEIKNKRSSS